MADMRQMPARAQDFGFVGKYLGNPQELIQATGGPVFAADTPLHLFVNARLPGIEAATNIIQQGRSNELNKLNATRALYATMAADPSTPEYHKKMAADTLYAVDRAIQLKLAQQKLGGGRLGVARGGTSAGGPATVKVDKAGKRIYDIPLVRKGLVTNEEAAIASNLYDKGQPLTQKQSAIIAQLYGFTPPTGTSLQRDPTQPTPFGPDSAILLR